MTIGQICLLHEYCTDCPERKVCTIRPTFYSDEEYQCWKNQTLVTSILVAKMLGFSALSIPFGEIGAQMMDKRRAKELELHSTFSPE